MSCNTSPRLYINLLLDMRVHIQHTLLANLRHSSNKARWQTCYNLPAEFVTFRWTTELRRLHLKNILRNPWEQS